MNTKPSEYLTDDSGNPSAMRLMCAVSLGCSVLFGMAAVAMSVAGVGDPHVAVEVSGMLAGLAFFGKAGQKLGERKANG